MHEIEQLNKISQRIADATKLSMEYAEVFQVAKYDYGEFYKYHYDFGRKDRNGYRSLNRVATVLIYLSNVSKGGATIFPASKTIIRPEIRSAVFWLNLHENGDGDKRSLHAGCPVLEGTKWISTKWLHEEGQEFLRPCNLVQPPVWKISHVEEKLNI
ncbi:hypothetical protein HHI36_017204 [Cryptolaemus montrouzieri]|uniref:Fe2OG dioxygenase domain-containing protein n=1 Tax=Cryptolaemus montrouzieri TaxID=559131 RepID=A0ABD2NM78_9CUCU